MKICNLIFFILHFPSSHLRFPEHAKSAVVIGRGLHNSHQAFFLNYFSTYSCFYKQFYPRKNELVPGNGLTTMATYIKSCTYTNCQIQQVFLSTIATPENEICTLRYEYMMIPALEHNTFIRFINRYYKSN